MKLIYQHMLGFLLIILSSIAIIGFSVFNFASEQTYQQNFTRLEGYANSLGKMAMNQDSQFRLNGIFLDELQRVMSSDDVKIKIFDQNNHQIYPKTNYNNQLPKNIFQTVKNGRTIHIKNDHRQKLPLAKNAAYTSVLVPWFANNHLVGAIWIGSRVESVEEPLNMVKRNLMTALLVTMIVGLNLSFILSYYSTTKIKRLSKATKKVAEGNFNVEIPHKNNDEIDDLAKDFNSMVKSLKESNEAIKAQEKRRDQFLADAAHEMRTPLTTINGILEGLQYDAIPDDMKAKSIALMQRETKRLIRLVNENLDYEKIRNNQIMLVKTNFNASTVLKDLKMQLVQNAKKADDQLIIKAPDKLEVYADHDRFTQIMVNLVQNAIQFTTDGRIIITGKRVDHGAHFSVKDNGIGMSSEQKKFIFDRFYKADPSRARLGKGESGLGLAIVLSLVNQHGGKIQVDSHAGQGTKFTVTLFDKGYEQFVESN